VWTSLSVDETTTLLKDVPRVYGAQVVDALLMALVESVAGWATRPWVTVNMIKSGRTERIPGTEYMDLTRTVGWFAMGEILLLEHRGANHPGEALESIKEQLRGLRGEGMILHMARLSRQYGKKGRFPDHVEELSFNYIGKSAQPAIGIGGVQSAPIFAGNARSDICHTNLILGCVGTISGNRLIWYWHYGKTVYDRATVEKIAASFMVSLRKLLSHCQTVSKENFTQDIAK
jgi:non-ribosomal peptide synthase protein (TIGR01720 family)